MAEKEFFGTGVKFPIQVNPTTGRFLMSGGGTSVKESVYLILMTQQGERFTRQEFGSRILSYTFMDVSVTMQNIMARDIESTILEQEPRIAQVEVTITPNQEQGCLMVDIQYMLRENQARETMVFPFYLIGEDSHFYKW